MAHAEGDELPAEAMDVRRAARAAASRTRRSRCSGTRGCCCPAACGETRRRPGAWACPGRAGAWRGSSSPAGCGPPRSSGSVVGPPRRSWPTWSGVAPSAVAFSVFLVVLLRVAHQVVQGEPVVGADEVDAVKRLPSVAQVQVGASREPRGQVRTPSRDRPASTGARHRGTSFHSAQRPPGNHPTW